MDYISLKHEKLTVADCALKAEMRKAFDAISKGDPIDFDALKKLESERAAIRELPEAHTCFQCKKDFGPHQAHVILDVIRIRQRQADPGTKKVSEDEIMPVMGAVKFLIFCDKCAHKTGLAGYLGVEPESKTDTVAGDAMVLSKEKEK